MYTINAICSSVLRTLLSKRLKREHSCHHTHNYIESRTDINWDRCGCLLEMGSFFLSAWFQTSKLKIKIKSRHSESFLSSFLFFFLFFFFFEKEKKNSLQFYHLGSKGTEGCACVCSEKKRWWARDVDQMRLRRVGSKVKQWVKFLSIITYTYISVVRHHRTDNTHNTIETDCDTVPCASMGRGENLLW
jgi:hypothetical protein